MNFCKRLIILKSSNKVKDSVYSVVVSFERITMKYYMGPQIYEIQGRREDFHGEGILFERRTT